jgi:hypothetical protein
MIKSSSAFIMCLIVIVILLAIASVTFLIDCPGVTVITGAMAFIYLMILPMCDKNN